MRSEVAIDVRAPAAVVFDVVGDPGRWASILPHYRSVRVLRRHRAADGTDRMLARYVAVRSFGPAGVLAIPILWRSWSWSDPGGFRLHFRHAGGATAGMAVTWRLVATPGGCRVTIEHAFRRRLPVPLLGRLLGDDAFPRLIDRLVVRPVAGRTLQTVRRLAEAVSDGESDPDLAS